MMHLKPLYEKIVLEIADKQEITSSTGLVYHKNMSLSANTTMVGKVVAVGNGRLLADGTIVPLLVKVGDKVIFSKIQGESYNDGVQDYTIISEQSIIAVIEEEQDNNGDN